jgi:hypothetical protein
MEIKKHYFEVHLADWNFWVFVFEIAEGQNWYTNDLSVFAGYGFSWQIVCRSVWQFEHKL